MRVRHPAVEATLTLVDRPERMRTDGALDALGWKVYPQDRDPGSLLRVLGDCEAERRPPDALAKDADPAEAGRGQ